MLAFQLVTISLLKLGLLDSVITLEQFDSKLNIFLSNCSQSREVDEGSSNRSGSFQPKQTELKTALLDSVARSEQVDDSLTSLVSGCPQCGDVEEGIMNRSGRLQQKQEVWKSWLWNSACFWKWTAVAFCLVYLITFAVVIVKSTLGPSAVLLRSDNGCYRTDWMPSMNKYFWNKEETDWNTSSRLCQEKNGTLAVLHDEPQVSELLKEYGRRYPWIGLYKLEEEFQWLDGTSWNSTVFPVIGYGDCVYLRKDGFSVNECTMRRSSLCRRKPCV
ncbi:C-type lectin domain family 2 member F-like [Lissotriton helveticus]